MEVEVQRFCNWFWKFGHRFPSLKITFENSLKSEWTILISQQPKCHRIQINQNTNTHWLTSCESSNQKVDKKVPSQIMLLSHWKSIQSSSKNMNYHPSLDSITTPFSAISIFILNYLEKGSFNFSLVHKLSSMSHNKPE